MLEINSFHPFQNIAGYLFDYGSYKKYLRCIIDNEISHFIGSHYAWMVVAFPVHEYVSICIILYVIIQLDQNHVLKMLSSLDCVFIASM